LQTAARHIESQIGLVIDAGHIYRSTAVGFDGYDFYNTCIQVHTALKPLQCLERLQQIEREMGRTAAAQGYQNRVIDLDIILFDEIILETDTLQVPHPRALDRNFVMQPLADIAAQTLFPGQESIVSKLAANMQPLECVEDLMITLSRKRYPIQHHHFIAIEGNIGSGKTSLTQKIAEDFNGKQVLERFADNPFLPLFYEDKERYSFPLEMSFLADRYQQLSDDVAQQDLFSDFTVADYYVIKSLIFSKITLDNQEYMLYKRLFHMMYKELVKPDLYLYLYQTEDRLLANIKKRGRDYEQKIEAAYLSQIQQGYADFIRTQSDLEVKVIDVSDLDFVNNHSDYLTILEKISGQFPREVSL
jgi:2-amino-4-hydroxy-6-hydroxymethyldihydropteridine diphosphokinase